MDAKELAALRAHYDTADTSTELDRAVLDTTVTESAMVGITVRLPAAVLNTARAQADAQGVKVTALLRAWIEAATAEGVDDDRMVRVSELRKVLAAGVPVPAGTEPAAAPSPRLRNVVQGSVPERVLVRASRLRSGSLVGGRADHLPSAAVVRRAL